MLTISIELRRTNIHMDILAMFSAKSRPPITNATTARPPSRLIPPTRRSVPAANTRSAIRASVSRPRKVEPEPDPEVWKSVQAKLAELDLQVTAVACHCFNDAAAVAFWVPRGGKDQLTPTAWQPEQRERKSLCDDRRAFMCRINFRREELHFVIFPDFTHPLQPWPPSFLSLTT